MFQLLAGRAAVPDVTYPDIQWNSDFVPPEYTLSQGGKAYARSGVNGGNNDLRNFLQADKFMFVDNLGAGYGYYWELDLTGSTDFAGYHGVLDADTAEFDFDQGVEPLVDGIAYRGDGGFFVDGPQVAAGLPTYGDGDTLMFAFDPLDGALWTGVNGAWDRQPWHDEPRGYAPLAGFQGLFVPTAQARAAIDAGVLKATPLDVTYPIPDGFISLSESNPNPVIRPQYWEFPATSGLSYSSPFARSSTVLSSNGLFNNRNALGVRTVGGASGVGVPTAGYYFEIYVSPVFNSTKRDSSVGFLPSSQWGVLIVPETLQWRGDGRLFFDGVEQFPRPPEWNNDYSLGTRLMFSFNPHTGSLWLGQDGVWANNPDADPPTFSYSIGLTMEWKVCVHHRGDPIPFIDKEAVIYALPDEFIYDLPANAIPYAQWV